MVGIKDAAGDPGASARVIAEAPDGFDLYSGDDAFTLPLLAVGGTGVIGVAAHWSAAEHAEMISAHAKGDVETARLVNARLLDSYDFETWGGTPQAVTTKALLRTLGLRVGLTRPPIGPVPDGLEDAARRRPGRAGAPLMAAPVNITFLGGLGEIGRNCACIESEGKIVLIDCGIMFPDIDMPGIDLVLPDFTYLRENADRIVGCIATHGHEDHVGGLSFLLRELKFPIYGSELTLGLARHRIEEAGLVDRTELPGRGRQRAHQDRSLRLRVPPRHPLGAPRLRHRDPHPAGHDPAHRRLQAGPQPGRRAPHRPQRRWGPSPRTRASACCCRTPPTPTRRATPARRPRSAPCSTTLMHAHEGRRLIVTCFASHIHRVQQVADAAQSFGRRVATLGLSMKKNVALARKLGVLRIPDSVLIDIEDIDSLPPGQVCVISTGSQGEPMSALARLASGDNRWLEIQDDRHRHPQLAPDPGQRDRRHQGHRRPRPRLGAKVVHTGHRRRARHRPRQAGGAQDHPLGHQARLDDPRARRVPPPGRPRRPRPPDGRRPRPRAAL